MVYVLIAVVVIVVVYALVVYNGLVKLGTMVDEAFSTMDVYLKKRWDLVPSLVEAVKGYAKHEKNTLEEVEELRNRAYGKMSDNEKIETNEELSQRVVRVMALAENYPKLMASENFQKLSEQLVQVEDEIANARKYYNAVVKKYNNKIKVFPNSIFARIYGAEPKRMFEIDEKERENVKVEV